MMGEGSGVGADLVLYLSLSLSSFQFIDLRTCLCYVIFVVCVLWVSISMCYLG